MTQFLVKDIPAVFEVVMERLGLILGQNDDFINLRINTITQGQVDKAIDPTKRDGGLGTVLGKRHEPFASTASHDKGKHIFHDIISIQ
jgi:hypothetical protein